MITITLPIRLENCLNAREHWSKRHKRNREQRSLTHLVLSGQRHWRDFWLEAGRYRLVEGSVCGPPRHIVVTITRIAPRKLDREDNLNASGKPVRDGVADWLGVDDGSDRVTWRYTQERGKPREYACRVEIVAA